MTELNELLSNSVLERADPIELAYFTRVVKSLDPTLETYLKAHHLQEPSQLENLVLADAIIKEIRRRDDKKIAGITPLIQSQGSISQILNQASLILSEKFDRKEYNEVLETAKANIEEDIRGQQFENIRRQMKPLKVYTSSNFKRRMGVSLVLLAGLSLAFTSNFYSKNSELIRYAEEHQARETFIRRELDVNKLIGGALTGKTFDVPVLAYVPEDKAKFDRLESINSSSISGSLEPVDKLEFLNAKIRMYDRVIGEERTSPIGLLAEFYKTVFKVDFTGQATAKDVQNMTDSMVKARNYSNLFGEEHLLAFGRISGSLGSKNSGLDALAEFGQNNAGTYLGDYALALAGGLYSEKRERFVPGKGLVAVEDDWVKNNAGVLPKQSDIATSNNFYREVVRNTHDKDLYAYAAQVLADRMLVYTNDKKAKLSHSYSESIARTSADFKRSAELYLATAGASQNEFMRNKALVIAGRIFIDLKEYETGNALLRFAADNTQNEDLKKEAISSTVLIGWGKFWDSL